MANITVAQLAAYLGIESRDSDQTDLPPIGVPQIMRH